MSVALKYSVQTWGDTEQAITVSPRGGGADDWASIFGSGGAADVAVSAGKPLVFMAGAYVCASVQQLRRHLTVICSPGVSIVSSLAPSGGGHLNSVFSYDQFTDPLDDSAVLDVAGVAGAITIDVTGLMGTTAALLVGAEIAIQDLTATNQVAAYTVVAVTGSAAPYTLTLDRPLKFAFADASPVIRYLRAKNIRLIGNGATISGTGDRAISLVSAWDCLVEGFVVDAHQLDTEYACSLDTGSYQSQFRRMHVTSGAATAIAIEACEGCAVYDSYATVGTASGDATNAAFMVQAGYDCIFENCHASGRTGASGAGLLVGFVSDTVASHNIKIIGGSFMKNLHGIDVSGSSQDVDIIGANCSYNSQHGIRVVKQSASLLPGRVRIFGGTIRGNGYEGCNFDGVLGCRMVGVYTEENGTSGHAGAFITANGAELFVSDCDFTESVATPGCKITGADSVAIENTRIRSTNTGFWYGVWVSSTGKVSLRGVRFNIANGNGTCALMNGAGVLYIADCINDGAAIANGVQASAGSVRRGPNSSLKNTTTPYAYSGTGHGSVGTVTLNGASAVDYTFADVAATDTVRLTLATVGGTQGPVPSYTITAGTKVSVTGTAADTSIYQIEIG